MLAPPTIGAPPEPRGREVHVVIGWRALLH